jgi:regulator of protease activity HflC (stomatin/prohibitin superfamily)
LQLFTNPNLFFIIGDIQPPETVVKAMHSQVSADRQKRALILESEGERQSAINRAEGHKQATILASEADKLEKINIADGEASAILRKAEATALSIEAVAQKLSLLEASGQGAVNLMVAERYMDAFGKIAKEGNTLLLPANVGDPAGVITQAMSIFQTIQKSNNKK